MPLCTADQDPGFRTMCQRVSKARPCWRGSDGPTGGLWTGEKKKTPNKPVNKTTQLVSSAWETYSQAEAFRNNIPESLEDAGPSFLIGCYGER